MKSGLIIGVAVMLLASPVTAKGFRVPSVKIAPRTSVPSIPRTVPPKPINTPVPAKPATSASSGPGVIGSSDPCGYWCGYWTSYWLNRPSSPARAQGATCDPKLKAEGLCPDAKK